MTPADAAIWSTVLPLMAAVMAFVWPRAAATVGMCTALAITALVGHAARGAWSGTERVALGGWDAPLGIVLQLDGLAALMLVMTAIVGLATSAYALAYFRGDAHRAERTGFWPLWLFLWAALNALFLSSDLFNVYVTLELMGLAAVALVALAGGSDALAAAMRYLLISLAGSLAYLMGVALLYSAHGVLDIVLLREQMGSTAPEVAALALMLVGLLLKTALFPLHFWLPPAHSGAPAPVSAILSALVVKASFYLLLRIWFDLFDTVPAPALAQALGILGAVAIFWGSVAALRTPRLKLLVAYSTVAQIGYLFLVFPLALLAGSGTAITAVMLFALSHALAKAAMFLAAGSLMRAAGHDRIADLRGAGKHWPGSVLAFTLAGISLAGLPPSGGFIAKWLMLEAGLSGNGGWFWLAIILLGGLLAAAYVARVLYAAFSEDDSTQTAAKLPGLLVWPALLLALAAIALGFVAVWPLGLLVEAGAS